MFRNDTGRVGRALVPGAVSYVGAAAPLGQGGAEGATVTPCTAQLQYGLTEAEDKQFPRTSFVLQMKSCLRPFTLSLIL